MYPFLYSTNSLRYYKKIRTKSSKLNYPLIPLLVLVLFIGGAAALTSKSLQWSQPTNIDNTGANFFLDPAVPHAELIVMNVPNDNRTFHLFSHGKPGQLLINNRWQSPAQIARWLQKSGYLHNKHHLNIYGCDFAKGEKGHCAVHYLETTLGISIAASDNITGRDGDWNLEVGTPRYPIFLNEYAHNLSDLETNLALSGTATASSELNANYAPTNAIDGSTNGNNPNFWHSVVDDTNPFLLIDLEGCYPIGCINIWNRTDCCGDRLDGAIIEVLDASNVVQYTTTIGTAITLNTTTANVTGNKIRIRKTGTATMAIAEVEVFRQNLALSGTATASSQLTAAYPPSDAIDGNTNGTNPNFWHSLVDDTNPFLLIDLGSNYELDYVNIWNRTDCCGERLDGAIVEVLDASNVVLSTRTIGTATTKNALFLNTTGQKVRIRKTGTATMAIAEVEVFEKQKELAAFALQPSCVNNVAQSDGYLQLSSPGEGDRYAYSAGSTFTGDPDYADAIDISTASFPLQFNTGLSNADAGDYTIRVFNGASDCYTDVVVTLNTQDCTFSCECTDYVYLNEIRAGGTVGVVYKFTVEPLTGALTELQTEGNPWYPGTGISELPNPHGLGVDLNGNLYIGESYWTGEIRRLTCDGELQPESKYLATDEIRLANITSIGNILYTNNGNAFSTCTGLSVGSVIRQGENGSETWGLAYDKYSGYFYNGNMINNGGIWRYTEADFNSGNTVPVFMDVSNFQAINSSMSNAEVRGITTDQQSNIYAILWSDVGNFIVKFDSQGNYITHMDLFAEGVNSGIGLAYSETSNKIYMSSLDPNENCISIIDLNLNTLTIGIGPTYSGLGYAKAIAKNTECCPTNNNITIDTSLCAGAVNDVLFLQELINCDGIICEGTWQEGMSNTGLIYNSCDNSVTINTLTACGSFTLESDGAGNNPQCGAFKITVNIVVLANPTVTLIPDSTICSGEMITLYGVLDTAGDPTYQWQQSTTSCLTGFTNIVGAVDSTYLATPTNTTYYRLITSSIGSCSSGNCADTSACVTIYPTDAPTATVADVLKCTSDSETITVIPSGGTGPYTYTWSGSFITNPGNVASFTASSPGTYIVTVTDSDGCTVTTNGEMTFQSKVCLPVSFTIRQGKRN